MAIVEKKGGPVLFRGDRKILGELHDVDPMHGHLIAARSPFVGADLAPQFEGALVGQLLGCQPDPFLDVVAGDHRLHEARSIPKHEEE